VTTRHQVSLITGVLILAILVPTLLSIWLAQREAHRQFMDEQATYASRVLIRSEQVVAQVKKALTQMDAMKVIAVARPIFRKCVASPTPGAIFRKCSTSMG
jgi:sensor c-di-GMP phosphodiesterase-like protein